MLNQTKTNAPLAMFVLCLICISIALADLVTFF
jgi:hypothetical protein